MPIADSFLASCRSAISVLPELTTFRTALSSVGVGSSSERRSAWTACFDDAVSSSKSPAHRLRKAIRETVLALADTAGTLSPLDRESVYRTMAAEFVPEPSRPPTLADESASLQQALIEDMLS